MVILPINDKWRISSDPHCWAVQERAGTRKADGAVVPNWRGRSYHTDLSSAVRHLAELQMRLSDAVTLSDALAEVQRIYDMLADALNPHFEVVRR